MCVTAWCCSSMSLVCIGAVCPVSLVCFHAVVSAVSVVLHLDGKHRRATCGGRYVRMAGGGHGVGSMRRACYLCQVEVMFQQRMCRLFCMALDVRLKALFLPFFSATSHARSAASAARRAARHHQVLCKLCPNDSNQIRSVGRNTVWLMLRRPGGIRS